MSEKKHKVVYLGLSGGVDSAVAGYLLKQQGYKVEAVFMQNWDDDNNEDCTNDQDLVDAKNISEHLSIPFRVVNFAKNYWQDVFEKFLDAHKMGYTPNPDILCNSEVKFKHFLNYALDNGADYIATGHYARIQELDNKFKLQKPLDLNKDQTYFLHALNQYQLSKSLFPLHNMTKPKIRKIAKDIGLPVANKKDSTGICFIGSKNYNKFISEYMLSRPGKIVSTSGEVIGTHNGLIYYTIGQRKGIGKGGDSNCGNAPWYVVAKDLAQNKLVVAQGNDNKYLFNQEVICNELHWISGAAPAMPLPCNVKIRYRQSDQECTLTYKDNKYIFVFKEKQRAVTPGQYAVIYKNNTCLGGGVIIS